MGVADGPLSTSAGSVTFLPGQLDVALLFQVDGVTEAPSSSSVSLQLLGAPAGEYLLNLMASMVTINLNAGQQLDAGVTPRADKAADWKDLLTNPLKLENTDGIMSIIADIRDISVNLGGEFTFGEIDVLKGIKAGSFDGTIGKFPEHTVFLKFRTSQALVANGYNFWTFDPFGCRQYWTTADLTTAVTPPPRCSQISVQATSRFEKSQVQN